MEETKLQSLKEDFAQALVNLEQALEQEKTEFMRDSAIKRFELCFDLCWKLIKTILESRGKTCTSPLGCFKDAYGEGLLDYEETWIEMVKTRNKTVHTYNQRLAEAVYNKLPEALDAFKKLMQKLSQSSSENSNF